jgi:hypothetical protein
MGLFDSIYLHQSLIPEIPELLQRCIQINAQDELQTKDLDCIMDVYHVGEDRKLMLRKAEYETVETPEGFFSFALSEISHEMVHVEKTCEASCCFYRAGRRHGDEDVWVDLKLVIIRGIVDAVEVQNIKITPSTPRIASLEQLSAEVAKRNQDPFLCVRRKLANICRRISEFFSKLQYTLLRY